MIADQIEGHRDDRSLPIALSWHYVARNLKYWLAVSALQLIVDGSERVWRVHFADVPDALWERAVRRSGVTFKAPPPGGELIAVSVSIEFSLPIDTIAKSTEG